jgi:uncharacterized membrane protein YcaP (DUF421 family)
MDPLRIATRALFAYVVLLVLVRWAGKGTVKHASVLDFTVALIVGDLIDDAVWAEVPAGEFVAAAGSLFTIHIAMKMLRFRSSSAAGRSSQLPLRG